mmetsp:Transcript_5940/g.18618  ORF Transcript_5940/g.18618 Transcript_5940/m.18618 type:complete len:152 (-) Transcript_5940:15-470(-)
MRRRAVLLSVACIAAAAKQARVDASAAVLRWTPADEFRRLHPNATDASPKTRLGREVKRSIAACVRRWPASKGDNGGSRRRRGMDVVAASPRRGTVRGRVAAAPRTSASSASLTIGDRGAQTSRQRPLIVQEIVRLRRFDPTQAEALCQRN